MARQIRPNVEGGWNPVNTRLYIFPDGTTLLVNDAGESHRVTKVFDPCNLKARP